MRTLIAAQQVSTSKRWLLLLVLLFSLFAISFVIAAEVPAPVASAAETWVVDLRGKSREEKLAALVLQGLLNRKGPRVYLQLENAWQDWKFQSGRTKNVPIWSEAAAADFGARYRSIQDVWMEILGKEGYTFLPITLEELLKSSRKEWAGWILYQDLSTDLAPVSTWAGLDRCIPITAALLSQWSAAGIQAPILKDYCQVRGEFAWGSEPRLEGQRWMLENLVPRCGKDGAVSRNRTYGLDAHDTVVDVDQAVQNQWVVYDLNHDAIENHSTKRLDQDPPDKEILDKILSGLTPFSFVYGWGRSGEENFIRSLNRNRVLGEVSGVPNNSFFAKLPAPAAPYQQKRRHRQVSEVEVENKIYVTFMVNEGDTLKAANSFQMFGSWLQPERGQVPINWGMEPNLLLSHPWLMHYYYQTMSENDYFFAPPSGWGYSHPGFIPEDLLGAYAAKVREGMALADLRYINVWWLGELRKRQALESFFEQTGAAGHVEWTGRQQVEFPSENFVNICSNHFYTYRVPVEDFAAQLIADTEGVAAPWFIAIYGAAEHATPYKFHELAKRLPSDRFKIVLLDEFFAAATKARPQIEGRVWKPGPNAPKGVAP